MSFIDAEEVDSNEITEKTGLTKAQMAAIILKVSESWRRAIGEAVTEEQSGNAHIIMNVIVNAAANAISGFTSVISKDDEQAQVIKHDMVLMIKKILEMNFKKEGLQ